MKIPHWNDSAPSPKTMSNLTTVDNYGWHTTGHVCSHAYLLPRLTALCQTLRARQVLDLGCGNGELSHAMANAGFEVVGCDADENGISLARRENSGARFEVASVYDDPVKLGSRDFDVVVTAEVIEHLFLPRHLPRFAASVLRPGGHLIVTTPYHGYLKNVALAMLGKWDHHHSPLWDGGHIKFWSRATLTRLLSEEGFTVTNFYGLGRIPYLWKSMILVAQLCDSASQQKDQLETN